MRLGCLVISCLVGKHYLKKPPARNPSWTGGATSSNDTRRARSTVTDSSSGELRGPSPQPQPPTPTIHAEPDTGCVILSSTADRGHRRRRRRNRSRDRTPWDVEIPARRWPRAATGSSAPGAHCARAVTGLSVPFFRLTAASGPSQ